LGRSVTRSKTERLQEALVLVGSPSGKVREQGLPKSRSLSPLRHTLLSVRSGHTTIPLSVDGRV